MEKILYSIEKYSFNSSHQQETADFLIELTQNDKATPRLLEWAGFLALENELWPIAEMIFASLLERRDKVLDLLGLAKSLRMQSRLTEAEECYLASLDKITQACSLLFVVYKALGEICLLKSDFYQAEEYYNKASALNPSYKNLIFYRAMMYLKEKNYQCAEQSFKNYLKFNSNSSKVWLGLAIARKALGEEELAWSCLEKCLDIEPQNSQALKLKKRWKKSIFENISSSLSFSA
ncbi:MAG: hypothetical protein OXJ52_03195 [Oligoflexia bacterium]|nr:hypothetical protein [Oligoflexia bacterium]